MYIKCGGCLWEDYVAYLKPKGDKGETLKCPECGSGDIFDNTAEPTVPDEYFTFPEVEEF